MPNPGNWAQVGAYFLCPQSILRTIIGVGSDTFDSLEVNAIGVTVLGTNEVLPVTLAEHCTFIASRRPELLAMGVIPHRAYSMNLAPLVVSRSSGNFWTLDYPLDRLITESMEFDAILSDDSEAQVGALVEVHTIASIHTCRVVRFMRSTELINVDLYVVESNPSTEESREAVLMLAEERGIVSLSDNSVDTVTEVVRTETPQGVMETTTVQALTPREQSHSISEGAYAPILNLAIRIAVGYTNLNQICPVGESSSLSVVKSDELRPLQLNQAVTWVGADRSMVTGIVTQVQDDVERPKYLRILFYSFTSNPPLDPEWIATGVRVQNDRYEHAQVMGVFVRENRIALRKVEYEGYTPILGESFYLTVEELLTWRPETKFGGYSEGDTVLKYETELLYTITKVDATRKEYTLECSFGPAHKGIEVLAFCVVHNISVWAHTPKAPTPNLSRFQRLCHES